MAEENLDMAILEIVSALHMHQEKEITGALIGELIRRVVPQLSVREVVGMPTGTGALSRFIDRYLEHVLIRDRKKGSDFVYLINEATTSVDLGNEDPELWKAFARPSLDKALVVRDTMLSLINTTDLKSSLYENLPIITSATLFELDQIRESFVDSQRASEIELPGIEMPYAEWSAALRKKGRDLYRSWTLFRVQSLFTLFEKRLDELNIQSGAREALCRLMQQSQLSGRANITAQKKVEHESQNVNISIPANENQSDIDFRSAMLEVVRRLSISELRELKLPAGIVFDASAGHSKK